MHGLNSTNNQNPNLENNLPVASIITKYSHAAIIKTYKSIHKLYIADRPEDSYIKKHAKCAGRTFFSVAKTVGKSYLALGVPTLAIVAGLVTNYASTENEEVYKNTNNLIYFGVAGLATTLTFSFCDVINQLREISAPELDYLIATDEYIAEINNYNSIANQSSELYDSQIEILRQLLDIMHEDHALLDQLTPEVLQNREAKIPAYDQLKQYEGDTLNPQTLSVISLSPLKDIEQPVIYNKQVYEYANLTKWYKIAESCPYDRGELNWQDVFRLNNNK